MNLRLLLDEDTEGDLADYLRKSGCDVERVVAVDELGTGSDDAAVMAYARRTDRIIVTHDSDYADPALEPRHSGVFYVPDQRLSAYRLFRIISAVVECYSSTDEFEAVVYLTENWL